MFLKFAFAPDEERVAARHTWLRHGYRRLASARDATKYLTTVALLGGLSYVHYRLGEELSFSIFYLLPITYAAWFLDAQAGFAAAIVSAIIWFTIEVTQHPPFSHDLIPVWNAAVRLGFFSMGVALMRTIKNAERRLVREVSARTHSLHTESVRRRRLERELMEVTSREHARLAQDLHDGLGQYVAALAFHVRVLRDDLGEHQSPHVAQAERILELVRTTNRTMRHLDRALRVPDASASGLAAAIRALAGEFQQLTGIACELQLAELPVALDQFRVLMLFRIVQEALNNAVKHGKPSVIAISTALQDGALCASIADNGRGLSLNQTRSREPGAGLRIMRLRAELIGGTLSIGSREKGGCIVECVVPLTAAPGRTPENGP